MSVADLFGGGRPTAEAPSTEPPAEAPSVADLLAGFSGQGNAPSAPIVEPAGLTNPPEAARVLAEQTAPEVAGEPEPPVVVPAAAAPTPKPPEVDAPRPKAQSTKRTKAHVEAELRTAQARIAELEGSLMAFAARVGELEAQLASAEAALEQKSEIVSDSGPKTLDDLIGALYRLGYDVTCSKVHRGC